MKRSEMIDNVIVPVLLTLDTKFNGSIPDCARYLLQKMEEAGMLAPTVKSEEIRGKDYPYGGGCTMRCSCEDCNPEFLVSHWSKE